MDECAENICHPNAVCTDTPGAFICTCNEGFEGDGLLGCASKKFSNR